MRYLTRPEAEALEGPRASCGLEQKARAHRLSIHQQRPTVRKNNKASHDVARLASIQRANVARKGHLAREGKVAGCYCDSTERRRVPNAGKATPPRRGTGTKSLGASHPRVAVAPPSQRVPSAAAIARTDGITSGAAAQPEEAARARPRQSALR